MSQLRKELQNGADRDGDVLVTRANGYVLQLGPDDVDVQRFERLVSAGERALAAGEPDRAAQRLRQGLALWRGPPLADFTYEPFAQQEIARLDELRLVAIEQRSTQTWRSAATRRWSASSRRSCATTRCASGYAASSCSRSTAAGGRPRRWRPTATADGT